MKCYILFEKNDNPICGCWKSGASKYECVINAEFALMCRYPNIEYDNVIVGLVMVEANERKNI